AVLDVVGRGPSADLRRRLEAVPGATLHADVASVTPFLDRATVAVNPAVTGSGVNIKLIDYLQAGLPVVSTSLATAGLPLRAGVDLEVADEPGAFAEACVRLLTDEDRRSELAHQGRQHVEELLDPEANLARVARALAGF
ncbi:MAG: glycosyl transferase group 1, partial [Frankiales bacterium]|nr:glycosyl transferase group 1 [Frankiales bacterium]